MPIKCCLTVGALLILSVAMHADEIVLKNGTHLTGSVVKLDDNKLVLQVDFATDPINIKWDAVAGFSTEKPLVMQTPTQKLNIVGVTRQADNAVVSTAAVPPITLPA